MAEELTKRSDVQNSAGVEETNTQDYISAINEIKASTVSKEAFDKIKQENKQLLKSLVNGTPAGVEAQAAQAKKSIKELRSEVFRKDHDNLTYVKSALELREALIEAGKTDPFLPVGKDIIPTYEDTEAANRVATVLQECVDYAQGDSAVFTNELQRRTVDTGLPKRR